MGAAGGDEGIEEGWGCPEGWERWTEAELGCRAEDRLGRLGQLLGLELLIPPEPSSGRWPGAVSEGRPRGAAPLPGAGWPCRQRGWRC